LNSYTNLIKDIQSMGTYMYIQYYRINICVRSLTAYKQLPVVPLLLFSWKSSEIMYFITIYSLKRERKCKFFNFCIGKRTRWFAAIEHSETPCPWPRCSGHADHRDSRWKRPAGCSNYCEHAGLVSRWWVSILTFRDGRTVNIGVSNFYLN
jgi:hypothetical protein